MKKRNPWLWRWIVNGMGSLCALGLVALVALWVRSYWVGECVICRDFGMPRYVVGLDHGRLNLGAAHFDPEAPPNSREVRLEKMRANFNYAPITCSPSNAVQEFMGVQIFQTPNEKDKMRLHWGNHLIHATEIVLPMWMVVLLAAMPVAWWVRRCVRRAWQRPVGACTCGYDLRAHKPGDRCPECGKVVAASPTQLESSSEGS